MVSVMKKATPLFSICLALLVTGALSSCGGSDPEGETPTPLKKISLTTRQEAIQSHEIDFSLNLFKEIVARDPNKNLMISPFSASLCLAMTATGAEGETYTQMASTLGFGGFTRGEVGEYYKTLCNGLLEADNTTKLAIANAVWPANDLSLTAAYPGFVKNWYSAEVTPLDFSAANAVEKINNWAKEHTNGMIPRVLEYLDASTRLLLSNALYFKGKWAGGDMTASKRDFTNFAGNVSRVNFFGDTRLAGYYSSGKGFTACGIPYGNSAYSLMILLPKPSLDINSFVASLTPSLLTKTMNAVKGLINVEVYVPSFKSDYTMDDKFKSALQSMGMQLPFSGSADFSGISTEPLFIGQILQKTAIDVNEKGSEAAAVTTVTLFGSSEDPGTSQPPVFIADRPFVYAIVEHSYNTILFLGIHGE